jgi:hypothetical protein
MAFHLSRPTHAAGLGREATSIGTDERGVGEEIVGRADAESRRHWYIAAAVRLHFDHEVLIQWKDMKVEVDTLDRGVTVGRSWWCKKRVR